MSRILKHDTDGTKPLLGKGEFGYDDYTGGGDAGRVYVGTGTKNIPLADQDSTSTTKLAVNQVAHGLAVLDAVKVDGSGNYVKAQSDAEANLAVALVIEVTDVDNFVVSQTGYFVIASHGLTVNEVYYLSDSISGGITSTKPSIAQNVLYVVDTNRIWVSVPLVSEGTTPSASDVSVTPVGDIAATDVQAAIAELDSEKLDSSDIGVNVQAYDANIAKTNVNQAWTGAQRGVITTDNDLSFDLTDGNNFLCTPTGNGTLTFTNMLSAVGQSGVFVIDNSGGHIISAPATLQIAPSDLSRLSIAGLYYCSYHNNGTYVYVSVSQAVTVGGA